MTPKSLAQLEKSTTGRFVRGAVRVLDAVAPAAAQRLAFDWFLTPRRRPDTPSIATHRFTLPGAGEGPDLAVWDWGSGRTVLLVHGWNGNAAQLAGFVPPLVRAGHYVVAPDLPAHGQSGGRRTNIQELASALLRLGRRVGPIHAVVAHSFGAAATVLAQAQGLDAARVVLVAPPIDLPRYAAQFGRIVGLGEPSVRGLLVRIETAVGSVGALDVESLAQSQTAPAVLIGDPEDREVPFAETRTLAAAWPGAALAAIAGAGHTRALRNSEVIARAVEFATRSYEPASRTA